MQIKTTVRYHLTPVSMASTKKTRGYKCWQWLHKREPSYTVDGNVNWYNNYENNMKIPQKVKNKTKYHML